MTIRDAVEADLPALLAIHNEAVRTTTAIWDEHEVDLDERRAWFLERQRGGFPVLVTERGGVVAGYASYGPWRPKSGYRLTVENSVYVLAAHHGHGLASTLLDELIVRARSAGLHRMMAMIESSNTISIGLHERRGFRVVGQMDEVGTKFGRWLDLTVMQLPLSP
ncbi:GNAT family N-acetyltransferase [Aeromicrobium chenweiae]|uniref:GNAT family N-acetyltransferase n=1 Tax=Aeromicrobium chenweiae TaxID=2079793 RepID=A0A2S0WI97_9ACTN|nr:GNAT family N-acetyltransferase [Aeromicrobium chenweiae]AWB91012.1 GNAT family N-acetyltransferase [Aeromicrobium chenweiae]TGN31916.1 N-acetyltransferase family protein [Aeromicrobium chenweiae]